MQVQPTPDSLDRLRHLLAARRRRRQAFAMGGAAAAVTGIALTTVLVGLGTSQPVGEPGVIASDTAEGVVDDPNSEQAAEARSWPGSPPSGVQPVLPSPFTPKHTVSATVSPVPTTPQTPVSPHATTGSVKVPACGAVDLRKTDKQAMVSKPDGGVGYGYLEFVNASPTACTVSGPLVASVVDTASGTDAGFVTARRSASESPALADVPYGHTLVLKPKDAYRFQFAWTAAREAVDLSTPCTGYDSDDASKSKVWAVRYQLTAKGPVVAQATLPAACRGTLYVTDAYRPGEYAESFGT